MNDENIGIGENDLITAIIFEMVSLNYTSSSIYASCMFIIS